MDLKIEKMTLDDLDSIQNILFTEFDNFWTYSTFKQELNCENSHFIFLLLLVTLMYQKCFDTFDHWFDCLYRFDGRLHHHE